MMTANETRQRQPIPTSHLDLLLTAQLAVAWAGEGGEEPRLGWWRTDLDSEFGGRDLFMRLVPHTFDWAVYQGVREAAIRRDAELRAQVHDPDEVISLFNLGFELDERVEERLQALKRSGVAAGVALPAFGELLAESFSRERFSTWVESHGEAPHTATPSGRLLKGGPPEALDQLVRRLVAGLAPLADHYPMPHFRRRRT